MDVFCGAQGSTPTNQALVHCVRLVRKKIVGKSACLASLPRWRQLGRRRHRPCYKGKVRARKHSRSKGRT